MKKIIRQKQQLSLGNRSVLTDNLRGAGNRPAQGFIFADEFNTKLENFKVRQANFMEQCKLLRESIKE